MIAECNVTAEGSILDHQKRPTAQVQMHAPSNGRIVSSLHPDAGYL
jgi:hypothetical protein